MQKFKKLLCILMTLCLFTTLFAGCGDDTEKEKKEEEEKGSNSVTSNNKDSNNDEDYENDSDDTSPDTKKIEGTISYSTDFSEGLALVNLKNDTENTYCIDKKGSIIFIIPQYIYPLKKFINGLSVSETVITDESGHVTYASDLGVTKFYDIALEGGYVFAEKITANYSSSKKELGILDSKLNWIIEPSETLYNNVCDEEKGSLYLTNSENYYYNDYYYLSAIDKFINLKTGKLIPSEETNFNMGASYWNPDFSWQQGFSESHRTYEDYKGNIMLDIDDLPNVREHGKFINGIAPVEFYNESVDKSYYSFINEKGDLLFEPIELKSPEFITDAFGGGTMDGDYYLVYRSYGENYRTYDLYKTDGTVAKRLNTSDLLGNDTSSLAQVTLSNGVLRIQNYDDDYHDASSYYFDIETLEPLF